MIMINATVALNHKKQEKSTKDDQKISLLQINITGKE